MEKLENQKEAPEERIEEGTEEKPSGKAKQASEKIKTLANLSTKPRSALSDAIHKITAK